MAETELGLPGQRRLDAVLGTQSAVAVIRVLANSDVPLSRMDLVRMAGIHPSGIPEILKRLEDAGVIESIGRGHSRPIRLRKEYPLHAQLSALFRAEHEHAVQLMNSLRSAIQTLNPRPDAAWIEVGQRGKKRREEAMVVSLLVPAAITQDWDAGFRRQLLIIQRTEDLSVEIRLWRRADLQTLSAKDESALAAAESLHGPSPIDLITSTASRDVHKMRNRIHHGSRDDEAREYARAIARQITRRPDLVSDAIKFIDRRSHSASQSEQLTLQEWRDILTTYSAGRLRSFLLSETDRATRLRQSMPFVAALTDEERNTARARAQKKK